MVYNINITGFPKDIKIREFKNMFIFYKDISTLSFNYNNSQSSGVIELDTIGQVIDIKKVIDGYKFDQENSLKVTVFKKDGEMLENEDIIKETSNINNSLLSESKSILDQEKTIEELLNNLISAQPKLNNDDKKESKLGDTKFKDVLSINNSFKTPPPGLNNRNDRVQTSLDALVNNQFSFPSFYNTSSYDFNLRQEPKLPFFNSYSDPLSINNTYFNDFNNNIDQKEMNNDLMNNRINNFKPASVNNTYLPRVQNNKSIHNSDRNSPCNTLFIGNLLFGTLEQDIVNLFSDVKGYQRLSLTYKIPGGNNESTRDPDSIKQMENNRQHIQNMMQKNIHKDLSTLPGPICFVEFESTQDATNAILSKNGELLDIKLLHDSNIIKSITSKNVRLSFSKNPFGVKPNPSLNDALNNNPKLSISAMPFYPPTNTTNNQSKMLPSQLHPTYTSIVTGNNLFHNHSTPTTPLSSQFNF